ncbi:DUF3810 domain-containing protein [Zunongwangia endophytica]|uniref:DUF3810 domain-containing protein n=1 Tax=Zunongwangia endophytica TaxID=1808945 RepID=A0ABV8H6Q4_9FLAO|nr:DUF3810 domain-containing protein [Zunongwangia endophytica]MDN3594725.1 DUF3810 domain-containing protein [Zunongwangia endophytica]
MKNKPQILLAVLLPFQIIVINLLRGNELFVESWYSRGVYPLLSKIMRWSLGILPFSFGDLVYAIFVILIIRWLIKRIRTRFRKPKTWITEALATLSIIYFCFHLFWGFNYYRLPLHESLDIDNEYSTEELVLLTEKLIEQSNKIHLEITEDDSAKVDIPYSKAEIFDITVEGYDHIERDFPELSYTGRSLKRSIFSLPLTYMGFNGYLNPFTGESQVNTTIVPFKIPTTASHEIGHQLGFAKENEANFIACLVTINHPDKYFRYSGFTFALRYCLGELFRRDQKKCEEMIKLLHPGILKNYQEVEDFWLEHQNPLEPFFQTFYNHFLIVNNQEEGLRSYSYVVALLVNYYDNVENAF